MGESENSILNHDLLGKSVTDKGHSVKYHFFSSQVIIMESVESRPKLLITGWSFVMGAGMLNVIAIGTPYWIYSSAILRVNYAGLWVFCTKYYLNAVAGCVGLG